MNGKKFYDSFWTSSYHGLKTVIQESRPDFLFADYQVEAAKDVALECQIPSATMWPQMPWMMLPAKYIPGQPGMQQRCLTSEHATLWDRLYDGSYLLRSAPVFLNYLWWTRRMRRAAGVYQMPKMQSKPDYLLFVNAMFGIEVPKDLPPFVNAVGPILSDNYSPLTPELEQFLLAYDRVLYVAFGTPVTLPFTTISKIIEAININISCGYLNGVIWALRSTARKQITSSAFAKPTISISNNGKGTVITYEDLLANKHPQYHFLDFAPQRAILAHRSTQLFLTHAGPSSANESLFHGVPMIAMGIYGDQLPNSMRLSAAGVAETVSKDDPALASTLSAKIRHVVEDSEGRYALEVLRLQRIAVSASKRKALAADLVDEVMYDHELRFEVDGVGQRRERRPMYLQTADMRMSWWRVNNVDLWLVVGAACGLLMGLTGIGWRIGLRWYDK